MKHSVLISCLHFFTIVIIFPCEILFKGELFMDTPVGESTVGELMPYIIVIVILLLIIAFCIFMAVKTSKAKKAGKIMQQKAAEEHQKKVIEHQNHMREIGAIMEVFGRHTYGLPVAEDAATNCYWCNDRILFETSGTSYNLSFEKLTDIAIKTDSEIQTAISKQDQYVSSAGRAVAGYMLLGPLGAAIGGRARKKTVTNQTTISKSVEHYLIFTYVDNNEVKCIAFEIFNTNNAQRFDEEFQKIKPVQTQSFDL